MCERVNYPVSVQYIYVLIFGYDLHFFFGLKEYLVMRKEMKGGRKKLKKKGKEKEVRMKGRKDGQMTRRNLSREGKKGGKERRNWGS